MELKRIFKPRRLAIGIAAVGALSAAVAIALAAQKPGDGPPQKDMAIDAAARKEAVEHAAALLQARYVYADKGATIAAELRKRLQTGRYDGITSADAFAHKLTDELSELSHDKHMELRYFEAAVPETGNGEPSAEEREQELFEMRWMNGGVDSVRRLPGNLGYIEIRAFTRPQVAASRIAAAMGLVAETKGLIIDLRRCHGGDPDTVLQAASYLYDVPTHLNDVYERYTNSTEKRWTGDVTGPRYGVQRKLYLLTSPETISGCEDFAYALQANHRAVIVGETTAGAANGGSPQRLGAHFMMFVPTFRPTNAVTGKDWEGVGVVPDHAVSTNKALEAAQKDLLQALIPVETNPMAKEKLQSALRDL